MIYGTLKSWDLVINRYLNYNQAYPRTETIDEKLSNVVVDFHKLGLKELECKYETCIRDGLDLTTARLRLHRDGQNKFQEPHVIKLSTWLRCLIGGFSYQLWGCFILSVISYKPLGFLNGNTSDPTNLGLAGVILFLILFHSGCNFYHVWALRHSLCKFESSIPTKVPVMRQGFVQMVPRSKLVVGDIIELRAGSVVPADVRVVTCHSLKLDISKLSGHDQPIESTTYATDENYMESSNVILTGSFVIQGYGQGLVIATGEDSVMGKIYNHVKHPHDHVISKELTSFMNFISALALGFGVFLILVWFLWLRKSYPGYITISSAVTNATTVIIAFIPEGISFGLTITLAVVSRRLSKHNVLARDLSSIGAAGNITRLLFDKTGTLTLREMQVKLIAFDQEFYLPGSILAPPKLPFEMLLTILNLCNSIAHPTSDPDATDIAILHFTDKFLPRYESSRIYHQLTPTPFRSEQTFMMALYQSIYKTNPFGDSPILMVKGAPETLLPYCKLKVSDDGKSIPIDINLINDQVQDFSNQAMRVLVVAYTTEVESNSIKLTPTTELIYVGMVGIMDTPRAEAKEMIDKCKGAGIKIMMMTGDHPTTAVAIGRQIGLNIDPSQVMTGEQLKTLKISEWDRIATSDDLIFARMSSYHKLRLIRKLQSYGHQVGMVGDGVNDTPSLQASDVGFSMGSSCEIAITSSQLVLMDNNLLNIPYIISQGRQVIENISVLLYIIPAGSLSETLPILMNTFLGIPQPLNSLLMTSISLITDLLPSVAVMANVSQSDLMSIPPRDLNSNSLVRKWPLLKSFLFIGISDYVMAHLSYFLYMYWVGGIAPTQLLFAFANWPTKFISSTLPNPLELQYTSQAMFFATLISLQIIKNGLMTHLSLNSLSNRLFHLRHNPNLWYLFSVLVAIVVTMIFLYVPFVNGIFKTRPLPLLGWVGAIIIALIGVILFETRLLLSRLPLHKRFIKFISP